VMPKHLLSGLDFTEGSLIGLDSIIASDKVEVHYFDLKSKQHNINRLTTNHTFDSLDLLIGAVSGNDYKQLADIALSYQIPFLSATFPNEGGIIKNPYTILLNPTINVHCQAIVDFIQQTFPTGNIIYFKKNGQQEEKIYNNIFLFNKKKYPKSRTNWNIYTPVDTMNLADINRLLDTSKQNILICGSLEEKFNIEFLKITSAIKSGNYHLIGMPNWETLKELQQNKHKSKTIYFSASFFNDGSKPYVSFSQKFMEKTNGKPSDIAYRGYDACFNFINLLIKHRGNFINQLNDQTFRQLIDYNIQPVKNPTQNTPDYFENKRVYIIKRTNGISSKAGKF
ncbi:MAG: hypothetical protein ACK5XN_36500, partial [Bacteroidota bacterium]